MPSGISKRQQLRNEKTLAELIRTVPGNDRCADCDALTPGWASWNMGIFLCMRCAALHRKLGTHISKVKSLSMDTWNSEQVDSMKSHGNILMNKIYNPRGIKPAIPTDVDEADACMERFIRQKYQHRSLENGKPKPPSREESSYSNPRAQSPVETRAPRDYDRSPEGSPPPLPPKSGKFFKFGLRSSSSTSNLRRFGTSKPKVTSPTSDNGAWSPPPLPSRKTTGLGAPVVDVTTGSLEAKMAALQDMGFTNDRRNEMVLRGLNEDLDRAVETLIRLGEGSNPISRSRTPIGTSTGASTREAPPKPDTSSQLPKVSDNSFPDMPSNNPFDRVVSNPIPQQSQTASYNPFDQPKAAPAPTQALESSFQGLQVSQPLFPHSTGGYPHQTSSMQQAPYQQPFTPPIPSTFSQSPYVASPGPMDNSFNPFNQLAPSQQQQPQAGLAPQSNPGAPQTNPFFNTAPQSQTMQPQAPQMASQAPNFGGQNLLRHANTMPAVSSPSFGSNPFQGQQQQQQQQAPNPNSGAYNFFQQGQTATQQNGGSFPGQYQANQQPQQLRPQPTGMDKNSILSLYNMAPAQSNPPPLPQQYQQNQQMQQPQNSQPQTASGMNPFPQSSNPYASTIQPQQASTYQQQSQPQQAFQQQQPQPPAPANNPFFGNASPAAPPSAPTGAGSGLAAQAGINPYQQQQQQPSGLGIGQANGQNGTNNPSTGTTASPFAGSNASPFPGMAPPFASTNKSPFAGPPPTNSPFRGHISQPSVDVSGLQNGRHSPDAFASLSARYG
ncbi:Arf GTPase activating protein [Penicillium brevicompactum]|uniref:Arf GTPase activating protein n=1 Tax=Penicillium brevicompactum TaxID=5074 RepID=A0A9W9QTH1_PENBR|nr:Arf GTPase activating protein [Penicillium brevicompactum]